MKLEIYKILAIGCNKRFMFLRSIEPYIQYEKCIRISKEEYTALKKYGIPTSQKLRWQKKN